MNVPIMSNVRFNLIKDFFKDTKFKKNFDELQLIACTKSFPNVLCIWSSNNVRYFEIKEELIKNLGKTGDTGSEALSEHEVKALSEVKNQLNSFEQIQLDLLPESVEKVLEILKKQPGFKNCFEVQPLKDNHKRFAVNISKE